PGAQRQLLHECPADAGRRPGVRGRHLGAREARAAARGPRHARADLQLSAAQQPVQRLRPDAGPAAHLGRRMIEVLAPGTLTTIQDWPGRPGLWEVGVPPSGPMDDRSLRAGNRLVGNVEGAPGLEVTLTGPRLRFADAAVVSVTGAPLAVELDGVAVAQWEALVVPAGSVLELGAIRRAGMRAYVLGR